MIFATEADLIDFAKSLGASLRSAEKTKVIELIGDVGAGKTTFTRGLALGLGISEPITSPSFNISKRYAFGQNRELIHYDFYRLDDPGLMSFELAEALQEPSAIIVIEWAGTVANLLPVNRLKIEFKILPDGSRELTFNGKPNPERELL